MKTRDDQVRERLEIFGTVVISIATLTIAWCSYQSSLWNGIQTEKLIAANSADMYSLEETTIEKQREAVDATVMINFMNAVLEKKQERVDYYITHVRPEMADVMKKWLETDPLNKPEAGPHPLATKEYEEILLKSRKSAEKKKEAIELRSVGMKANENSDNYVLYTVIFSMVLFLNGISSKLRSTKIMRLLSIVSGIVCVLGLVALFMTLPVISG